MIWLSCCCDEGKKHSAFGPISDSLGLICIEEQDLLIHMVMLCLFQTDRIIVSSPQHDHFQCKINLSNLNVNQWPHSPRCLEGHNFSCKSSFCLLLCVQQQGNMSHKMYLISMETRHFILFFKSWANITFQIFCWQHVNWKLAFGRNMSLMSSLLQKLHIPQGCWNYFPENFSLETFNVFSASPAVQEGWACVSLWSSWCWWLSESGGFPQKGTNFAFWLKEILLQSGNSTWWRQVPVWMLSSTNPQRTFHVLFLNAQIFLEFISSQHTSFLKQKVEKTHKEDRFSFLMLE